MYKNYGVKYVLTRTVGYNHIDLEAAKEFGLKLLMYLSPIHNFQPTRHPPNSYAVLCLEKKKQKTKKYSNSTDKKTKHKAK
ncbi:hypothetical protein PT064_08665 [Erysipelothrix rhusiopathiae]|nr:hypothetical protein [Erysipelothrix rhusiopathiae]